MSWPRSVDYSLYLVADASLTKGRDFLNCVREAILGGVSVVQLRAKDASGREFYELAEAVHKLTASLAVPLIINDRLDIALAVGAEGVHLGQQDLPARVARILLGEGMLLGISAATLPEALEAEAQGADYLGVGAVFPTTTKGDVRSISLAEVGIITGKVSIPVLAIGGITAENAPQVLAQGAHGICVAGAILGAKDTRQAASRLRTLLPQGGQR